MPTYDYRCLDCGVEFERFQSMNDDRLKDCPDCQGSLKRLIGTGAGIIFKGSGFYETDYRSPSYKKAADKENKPTSGTGDSATTKPKESTKKTDGAKVDA
jgi:putative FmdB family regulatory protein